MRRIRDEYPLPSIFILVTNVLQNEVLEVGSEVSQGINPEQLRYAQADIEV